MRLYHGTNMYFEEIDLTKSKPNKDFGRGFYLSADYNQALNMAEIKVEQLRFGKPTILEFELDEKDMASLKTLRFDRYNEEWAEFIIANRKNRTPYPVHDFDIVIGPIANDRVGIQLWRYENQQINLSTLVERLQFMKGITIQYFFGTERAVALLNRIR